MPNFRHIPLPDTRERQLDPSTHLLDRADRRKWYRIRTYILALGFAAFVLITVGIVAVVSP